MRAARVDIAGVVTLGMITAVGGGIIRDVLLGAVPPAAFVDWRYLSVAAGAGGRTVAGAAGGARHLLDIPAAVPATCSTYPRRCCASSSG